MATETLQRGLSAANPASVPDTLEEASTGLETAQTLIRAIDNFIDSVRGFVVPGGAAANVHLVPFVFDAMILIGEASDKIEAAKDRIDESISRLNLSGVQS